MCFFKVIRLSLLTWHMFFHSRDEPTVAVDPLLRQAIWVQLHRMVEEHRTTIIISTHYIQVKLDA